MTFIDLFAGCGGMRKGLELAGHKCLGFCEFDKYARQSYKQIFDTEGEWESHDIRTVESTDIPRADLWSFGFPCQDISIAGKQKGLQGGERSGLFYEVMRLLAGLREENKPRWLLIENVKNLLSIGRGFDFARLLIELGGHGYDCQWQLFNSKDYGVPQSRTRVFIVGHLRRAGRREVFPISPPNGENSCQIRGITKGLSQGNRIYRSDGLSVTLSAQGGGLGAKTGLYAVSGIHLNPAGKRTDIASCLVQRYTAGVTNHKGENTGVLLSDERVRRLTPRECFRLQGFTDEDFNKIQGVSDTQLYRQAGNAVTVNVAKAIGEKIKIYEV